MTTQEANLPQVVKPLLASLQQYYQGTLGENLSGIYVHGSIAMQCFNIDTSDIDILVVVQKKLVLSDKHALARIHLTLSDQYQKSVELSVVTQDALQNLVYPTPYEFHYSDAHKEAFRNGEVDFTIERTDYDLVAHFVVTHRFGIALLGKPVPEVFPIVPRRYFLDSIARDSEDNFNNIMAEIDNGECAVPLYAVLNFCRALAFIQDDLVISKSSGAKWGLAHLPSEFLPIVQEALNEYLEKGSSQQVSCQTLKVFAVYAKRRLDDALASPEN